MMRSSRSCPSHLDLPGLVRRRPRELQRDDATIETRGYLVGIDPEWQDDAALKLALWPFPAVLDGLLRDIDHTLAAEGNRILVHRDLDLLRTHPRHLGGDERAVRSRPYIDLRELRLHRPTEPAEQAIH